jgi:hypothetical protein
VPIPHYGYIAQFADCQLIIDGGNPYNLSLFQTTSPSTLKLAYSNLRLMSDNMEIDDDAMPGDAAASQDDVMAVLSSLLEVFPYTAVSDFLI